MPKFRKKPVVIEAMKWTGANVEEMLAWFSQIIKNSSTLMAEVASGNELVVENDAKTHKVTFDMTQKPTIKLLIKTLEGTHEASHGDWVICGVKGELYPCKPDIFEQTYEPA